jgi:hypothetical protein
VQQGSHGYSPELWRDLLAPDVDFVLDVFVKGGAGTPPKLANCVP